MSVAIITDGRGDKREAAGSLHTPPLRLHEQVPPGLWLLLIAVPLCTMAAPPLVLFLVPAWFVSWLLWWFFSGRQVAAQAMALQGACPSCEYEIVGLPVERDGCVVCPECGGAWRVEAEPSA